MLQKSKKKVSTNINSSSSDYLTKKFSDKQHKKNLQSHSHGSYTKSEQSLDEAINTFCEILKKDKTSSKQVKKKLDQVMCLSVNSSSNIQSSKKIEDNINLLNKLYNDIKNQEIIPMPDQINSVDGDSVSTEFNSNDASADFEALLAESSFLKNPKNIDHDFHTDFLTEPEKNKNIVNIFTIPINVIPSNLYGKDLINLNELIKKEKISMTSSIESKSCYELFIRTKNCSTEEFYKITFWLKEKSIIEEAKRNQLMLAFFSRKKLENNQFDYEKIKEEYENLNFTVKTMLDKNLLKFFKLLNPLDYKNKIVHVDTTEIIETLCNLINTSQNVLDMLLNDCFDEFIQLSATDLPKDFLPYNINHFINSAKRHFMNIFTISALLTTKNELCNDNVSLKSLLSTANEYFYNYKGRENCVEELSVLLDDIKNASINHSNNSLANKIRKTVESLLSSLYKK
ncbi:hypothetical protein NUSPORA_00735 [Nucleospora cyclopteri]